MTGRMNVLGIDPGTRRIGYGLIAKEKGGVKLIEADLLPIKTNTNAEALAELKAAMDALLARTNPDIVAVEKLFFAKNRKTAMDVAAARGVIILAIMESGIPLREYAPNDVKVACTGFGGADKKAVAKMVRLMLNMPEAKLIDDVTDAIAIAICALQREKLLLTSK